MGGQAALLFLAWPGLAWLEKTIIYPADHQIADFYRSRNTAEPFVLRALDTPFKSIRTPTHAAMYEAGFATLKWSERKAGY